MRWLAPKEARHGDKRVVRKYAWLPKRMDSNDMYVWLEPYEQIQEFRIGFEYAEWTPRFNRLTAQGDE